MRGTQDKEVFGWFGIKEYKNAGGQMEVDFSKSMEIVVVNTDFRKKKEKSERVWRCQGRMLLGNP